MNDSIIDRITLSQYGHKIDRWWVLLDNKSTVDLFSDKYLLKNISKENEHTTVHCNAGKIIVNVMADLPGYDPVWYWTNAIADILSLFLVAQRFHIQYDSRVTGSYMVWKNDDICRRFDPGSRGLFYSDYKNRNETALVSDEHEPEIVNTVRYNLTKFNQR